MPFTNDRPSERHYALNLVSRRSGGARTTRNGFSSTALGTRTEGDDNTSATTSENTTRVFSLDTQNKRTVSSEVFSRTYSSTNNYSRTTDTTTVSNTASGSSRRKYSGVSHDTASTITGSSISNQEGGGTGNGNSGGGGNTFQNGSTRVGSSFSLNGSISRTENTFSFEISASGSGSGSQKVRAASTNTDGETETFYVTLTGSNSYFQATTASFLSKASQNNSGTISTTTSSASQRTARSGQDGQTPTNFIGEQFNESSSSTFNNPIGGVTQGTRTSTYQAGGEFGPFYTYSTYNTVIQKTFTTTATNGLTGTEFYEMTTKSTSFGNTISATRPTISRDTVTTINSRLPLRSTLTALGGGAYLEGGNTLLNGEVLGASRVTKAEYDRYVNTSYNEASFNLRLDYTDTFTTSKPALVTSAGVLTTTVASRNGTRLIRTSTSPTVGIFDFGLKTINSLTYITQTYSSLYTTITNSTGLSTSMSTESGIGGKFTFSGSAFVPTQYTETFIAGDITSSYSRVGVRQMYDTTFQTIVGRPGNSNSTLSGGYTLSTVVARNSTETATGFAGERSPARGSFYTLLKNANGGIHYGTEASARNNIRRFGGISITCERIQFSFETTTVPTNATNTAGTDIRTFFSNAGTTSYKSDALPLGISFSAFSGVEFLPTDSSWFIFSTSPQYSVTISHSDNRTSSIKANISTTVSFFNSDNVQTQFSTTYLATGAVKVDEGALFAAGSSLQYYSTLVAPVDDGYASIIYGDDFADSAGFFIYDKSDQLYDFTARSDGYTQISTGTVTNTAGKATRDLPNNAMLFINSSTKGRNQSAPVLVYNSQ